MNCLLHAFATVGGGAGVAELEGFVNSGASAGWDKACECAWKMLNDCVDQNMVVSTFVCCQTYLYGWIASRVKPLSSSDRSNV